MQIGISIMLAFSVFKLRLSDDVPVQSDSVPLINIYFTLCMMTALCAMLWFSLMNILREKKKLPVFLKCFVLRFLKCTTENKFNKNKKENKSNNNISSQKSNEPIVNECKSANDNKSPKSKLYQFNEKKLVQIIDKNENTDAKPIVKIQHNNDIKQVSFNPKKEGLELKIKNLAGDPVFNKRIDHYKCPNQYEYLIPYIKTPDIVKWEKNNSNVSKSSNNNNKNINNSSPLFDESNDLELISLLNKFMFYVFLIFLISLNLFGLYIFPYLIKKPLSIEE
jgi:hypothetical protein